MKEMIVSDGARMIQKDRETLSYQKGEYEIDIWSVDKPALFSNVKILNRRHLKEWKRYPDAELKVLSQNDVSHLLHMALEFYSEFEIPLLINDALCEEKYEYFVNHGKQKLKK